MQTARSAFTFSGNVLIGDRPTVLDLEVKADRFAFQEWSGVLTGLKNIAVEAAFDTSLKGPLTGLDTRLALAGTGGSVKGQLTLNTRVPGWHATGAVDVGRINLARWLNRSDRPSDITGHVAFDLDLDLGRRFPRGTYEFDGPHAMYMNYAADDLHAQGRLTAREVLIDRLTARAYRAHLSSTTGSIGLDNPYPYHFQGSMSELDLRFIPETVPVPRVESVLALDYDVVGSFSRPFITGEARFRESTYLGATIRDGMVGTIDTASSPIRYSGDGDIDGINLQRFGEGLEVALASGSAICGDGFRPLPRRRRRLRHRDAGPHGGRPYLAAPTCSAACCRTPTSRSRSNRARCGARSTDEWPASTRPFRSPIRGLPRR